MDLPSLDQVVFEANLLPDLIEQLGLVIHVAFALEYVAFPVVIFNLYKGLAGDKACYTTSIGCYWTLMSHDNS